MSGAIGDLCAVRLLIQTINFFDFFNGISAKQLVLTGYFTAALAVI